MADFRYYCDKHNMVYSHVRRKDGSSVLACRKCMEAAEQKLQAKPGKQSVKDSSPHPEDVHK